MNRRDRLRAFQLRLDGKTWAEIGEALNYTGQTVARDLAYVIRKGVRRRQRQEEEIPSEPVKNGGQTDDH